MNDDQLTPTIGQHSLTAWLSSPKPCRLAALMVTTFAITLAALAAHRLRGQALAVLIGIASGAGATILATILLTEFNRRTTVPPPPVSSSPCLPLSQIPSLTNAERELAEDQYWRGYRRGWIQAANTMLDLATDQQLPPQAAYYACTRHWQTLLPYQPRPEAQCQP